MARTYSKLDTIAVTASKTAADRLHLLLGNMREDVATSTGDQLFTLLTNLREDIATAMAGTALYHKGQDANNLEANANSSDLPTVLVLANSLKALANTHLASALTQGAHAAASAEAIVAVDATDQSTANTLLNEIKADYNTHLTESGVHLNDDSTNTVTAADASDLATSITLSNEIKADYNAHVIVAMVSAYVTDVYTYHKGTDDGAIERTADATTLPTVLVLANSLKVLANLHLASTGTSGAHAAASAEAIAAADATDQSTVNTLLNEIKADYNTHLTESLVHLNDDPTNTVTSADASDLATSLTVANEIKADYNAHVANAMTAAYIQINN